MITRIIATRIDSHDPAIHGHWRVTVVHEDGRTGSATHADRGEAERMAEMEVGHG